MEDSSVKIQLLEKLKKYYPGFNKNYQFFMQMEVEEISPEDKSSKKESLIFHGNIVINNPKSYEPKLDISYSPTEIVTDKGKVAQEYLANFWENEYEFIEKMIADSGVKTNFGEPYENGCSVEIRYNLSESDFSSSTDPCIEYAFDLTGITHGVGQLNLLSLSYRLTGEAPKLGFEFTEPAVYGEKISAFEIK